MMLLLYLDLTMQFYSQTIESHHGSLTFYQ